MKESLKEFLQLLYEISTFQLFIKENNLLYKKCKCDGRCICHYGLSVMKFDPDPAIQPPR